MPTPEDRIAALEKQIKDLTRQAKFAFNVANALQGLPSDATLSLPHNDSLAFGDNVDATHPANLRYVVASNVQKVVSARLSVHLAPYRTYNNFSATVTGGQSVPHFHPHTATHPHSIHIVLDNITHDPLYGAGSGLGITQAIEATYDTGQIVNATSPGNTDNGSVDHTHNLSVTSTLGVTEGIVAAGVTISFDGVDATAALGGPFNADMIELDVRRFLLVTQGVYHTIALQPSGNGRIEAHLRLGYYASAGQVN